jgi:hypothetical protein
VHVVKEEQALHVVGQIVHAPKFKTYPVWQTQAPCDTTALAKQLLHTG